MHNDVTTLVIAIKQVVAHTESSVSDPVIKGQLRSIESMVQCALRECLDRDRDTERMVKNYETTITKLKNKIKKANLQ